MNFGLIHPTMKVRITVISYLDYELCFLATQLPSCLSMLSGFGRLSVFLPSSKSLLSSSLYFFCFCHLGYFIPRLFCDRFFFTHLMLVNIWPIKRCLPCYPKQLLSPYILGLRFAYKRGLDHINENIFLVFIYLRNFSFKLICNEIHSGVSSYLCS